MKRFRPRTFWIGFLAGATLLLILLAVPIQLVSPQNSVPAENIADFQDRVPLAAPHPLPSSLAAWSEDENYDNYFDQIQPTSLGHLVWSEFPIKIYLEHGELTSSDRPSTLPLEQHYRRWAIAVQAAIEEWNQYLPLTLSASPESADIVIQAQRPPLRWSGLRFDVNSSQALGKDWNYSSGAIAPDYRLSEPILGQRAETAETTYTLHVVSTANLASGDPQWVIRQRYRILIAPQQTDAYTKATARHELGHALGIWGHSPLATDALYYSQVANPVTISTRDINTLKKIYQQPTQLGWPLISP